MSAKEDIIRLIKIGNSSGIIIKKKILEQAGIDHKTELLISLQNGKIVINPSNSNP